MAQTGDVWTNQGFFGDGRFNGTMQNVVGPTLVAMATKFGLGTEIQSPTGLSVYRGLSSRLPMEKWAG